MNELVHFPCSSLATITNKINFPKSEYQWEQRHTMRTTHSIISGHFSRLQSACTSAQKNEEGGPLGPTQPLAQTPPNHIRLWQETPAVSLRGRICQAGLRYTENPCCRFGHCPTQRTPFPSSGPSPHKQSRPNNTPCVQPAHVMRCFPTWSSSSTVVLEEDGRIRPFTEVLIEIWPSSGAVQRSASPVTRPLRAQARPFQAV